MINKSLFEKVLVFTKDNYFVFSDHISNICKTANTSFRVSANMNSDKCSLLQPMDQGVIPSLKARYRTKVVQKVIEAIDGDKSLPNISVLDAMKMLVLSWDEVTDKTVQNCFKKAGFCEIEEDDAVSDDPERYRHVTH